MTFEVILHFMNNLCLHNVDILEKFKRFGIKQKYIAEKNDFEILRWPYVTFNDPNCLLNECPRKKKAKIPEFHSLRVFCEI